MPSRQITSNGIARIGSKVQKVTPPARKRRFSPGSARPPSQASRATDSGTASMKPAVAQAASQACRPSCSAATVRRSRSSVGASSDSTSARPRSAHAVGVAGVLASAHQRVSASTSAASAPTNAASSPPTSA